MPVELVMSLPCFLMLSSGSLTTHLHTLTVSSSLQWTWAPFLSGPPSTQLRSHVFHAGLITQIANLACSVEASQKLSESHRVLCEHLWISMFGMDMYSSVETYITGFQTLGEESVEQKPRNLHCNPFIRDCEHNYAVSALAESPFQMENQRATQGNTV